MFYGWLSVVNGHILFSFVAWPETVPIVVILVRLIDLQFISREWPGRLKKKAGSFDAASKAAQVAGGSTEDSR